MPILELYRCTIPFLITFGTSYEARILMFGVSNAKNLAVGSWLLTGALDANAISFRNSCFITSSFSIKR